MTREQERTHDRIPVEDYIEGKEVALEGILDRGHLRMLALFDKPDPLEGPFFEETLYVTPSRLKSEIQNQIIQGTQQAAQALGLVDGPIHAELRVNRQRPWIVEVAARSIGGLCSRTLRFGTGKPRHQLFLEPEGLNTNEIYVNGLSTSMPVDVQLEVVRSIEGLQTAEVIRPGYAIEYDYVEPTELYPTLETKRHL